MAKLNLTVTVRVGAYCKVYAKCLVLFHKIKYLITRVEPDYDSIATKITNKMSFDVTAGNP